MYRDFEIRGNDTSETPLWNHRRHLLGEATTSQECHSFLDLVGQLKANPNVGGVLFVLCVSRLSPSVCVPPCLCHAAFLTPSHALSFFVSISLYFSLSLSPSFYPSLCVSIWLGFSVNLSLIFSSEILCAGLYYLSVYLSPSGDVILLLLLPTFALHSHMCAFACVEDTICDSQ